ncbi:MAG: nitrous oxide-stimulated promoter family protein [Treponema sp.]|nr:nitrous oxide-stimulated promoter family protein [Treponema sp.]
MTIEEKRENEWRTVFFMIQLYCKGKHKNRLALKNPEKLCDDCKRLSDYVYERVKKCPFMETKTFCSACRVHCYKAEMRQKIREVMRFSGPRMLFYHPLLAIKHVLVTIMQHR